jgi:ribose-phosphate pyrophosphokinase
MSLKLHLFSDTGVRKETAFDLRKFPAGETFLRIGDDAMLWATSATIELAFEGNDDLFNLALLVDALRRKYESNLRIHLYMPYLPYARQDRVCAPGESLSIKVACDFINGLKLTDVRCHDIHSSVGSALLDNLTEDTLDFVFLPMTQKLHWATTVLVSPDAGANKKVLGVAKAYAYPNVVRADKTRDVLTGRITGTAVYSEHVGTKDFLIVDDICDGGRTFIELAKELRKLTDGKIYLYVTHGIFSAPIGAGVFEGLIDGVYVSNLMGKAHPLITVL